MIKSLRFIHILPLTLWLSHFCLLIFKIYIPLIDNYLDDVVVIPIILGLAIVIQQNLLNRNSYTISNKTIIYSWLYFCIVFEVVIPQYHNYFTADWFDCIAYGIGALYFYLFQNKPLKNK